MIGFATRYWWREMVGTLLAINPNPYVQMAFDDACVYHDKQWRRNRQEPYVAHPLRVAEKFRKLCPPTLYSNDAYAACLLHDVKEDCDVSNAILIAKGYTPRTVELVAGITRYPWETKEMYIDRILESDDLVLLLMKLCDGDDNMVINPFNLDGFKDWRASVERYQKTQKKLIQKISELTQRDYIKYKLENYHE